MKDDRTLRRKIRSSFRLATASRRPLPDILIIGAQKCGTTSLFNYLTRHPGISRGITKEVHYFDFNHDKGDDWYRSHFPLQLGRTRPPATHYVDASPYYLFDELSPARAARTVPEARVIALLRCPVERAWSHYQHSASRSYDSRPFDQAIKEEIRQIDPSRPTARFAGEDDFGYRQHSYVRRGVYAPQVARWLTAFPAESVLVLDANRFFAETTGMMAAVFSFLGLEAPRELDFGRSIFKKGRYTSSIPQDSAGTLAGFYRPYLPQLKELTGQSFSWEQ